MTSEELQKKINEFLQKGGVIEKLPDQEIEYDQKTVGKPKLSKFQKSYEPDIEL